MLNPNGGCVTPNELFPDVAEKQAIEREIERVIIADFRSRVRLPSGRLTYSLIQGPMARVR